MKHKGYFTQIMRGQPVYRCCSCQFDTFIQQAITEHVVRHVPYELLESPHTTPEIAGKKVVISLISWNNGESAQLAAAAINAELTALEVAGAVARGIWVDNGSSVKPELGNLLGDWDLILNPENKGQSVARNQVLTEALSWDADYWIMIDGDIMMVPGSAAALISTLMGWKACREISEKKYKSAKLGCVGMHAMNCTKDHADSELASFCHDIPWYNLAMYPQIAWTQYGAFDMEAFRGGVRFETKGPFSGPGYGLEDDDLWMQFVDAGYAPVCTNLFKYLHLERHSSLRLLNSSLAAKLFEDRKDILLRKWSDNPNPHIQERLHLLASHHLPVVV